MVLVVPACVGGASNDPSDVPSQVSSGGTLRLASVHDPMTTGDPQKEYSYLSFGMLRCCLLRTLLSYKGFPTADGGTDLFPDLAVDMPAVSGDALTWTFTLKTGITYAPPFDAVEVTSGDFVRTLEREADPDASVGGYSFYYSIIEGFDEFSSGKAASISGLETPDDKTLVIELTRPSGDLGYRLAMPAAAPIPPNGDARLGAAEGHTRDYGRFLVATGPYMFQGSEDMDFSLPTDQQTPVSGLKLGLSIVLVRNPSYDPATDGLRPAYVDEINVSIGGDVSDLFNQVSAGDIDAVMDVPAPPAAILRMYTTDPSLEDHLHIYPADAVGYISMNLAEPPFDDIAVRRAVNYAIDKRGLLQLGGGESTGQIAGHIMTDSLEDDLLKDYDPYATPNSAGDVSLAMEAMKESIYDTNGDGVCDAEVCTGVLAVTMSTEPAPRQAVLIQQNLDPLGITFDVKEFAIGAMYSKCNDPVAHVPICLATVWGRDFPDGVTFGPPLFGSESIFPSCCNYSLVGATPEQLKNWGYEVATVPSVDDTMAECSSKTGDERVQCWADADRSLMETVVPWVPWWFVNAVSITSERIVNYSFDQFCGCDALDHFAIAPEAQ